MPRMKLAEALKAAGVPEDQIPGILAACAPDSQRRNTSPEYLRGLLEQAGLSVRGCARLLDIRQSVFRDYLSGKVPCPYPVQYCLEVLADQARHTPEP